MELGMAPGSTGFTSTVGTRDRSGQWAHSQISLGPSRQDWGPGDYQAGLPTQKNRKVKSLCPWIQLSTFIK